MALEQRISGRLTRLCFIEQGLIVVSFVLAASQRLED